MSKVREVEEQARLIADDTVTQLTALVGWITNSIDAAACAAVVTKLRADLASIDWTRGAWHNGLDSGADVGEL